MPVNVSVKDNSDFASPEPVYVYTVIIKQNLFGYSYVRLLTTLHFPSTTGYHRFNYPLYGPKEQSFIESITIRLVTKNGEDVLIEDSVIPVIVTLHFKKKSSHNKFRFVSYNGSIYTVLGKSKLWWRNRSFRRASFRV